MVEMADMMLLTLWRLMKLLTLSSSASTMRLDHPSSTSASSHSWWQKVSDLIYIAPYYRSLDTGRLPSLAPELLKALRLHPVYWARLLRCDPLGLRKPHLFLLHFGESTESDDEPVDDLDKGDEAEAETGAYESPRLGEEPHPGEADHPDVLRGGGLPEVHVQHRDVALKGVVGLAVAAGPGEWLNYLPLSRRIRGIKLPLNILELTTTVQQPDYGP